MACAAVGHTALGLLLLLATIALLPTTANAAEPTTKPIREIFVPFDDLNVLLKGDAERAFLTRDEYEELITKAKRSPIEHAPHQILLLSADYETTIRDERASIAGKLWIEVLEPGLHALPIELNGVGIRRAMLDGKPASLGRSPQGHVILFADGVGKKLLELDLVTMLQTSAAQQSLQFTLPTPAATKLQVNVPGNVEVRSGAAVVSRTVDKEANVTRFELLPKRGPLSLVMSLNNKLLLERRVVMARSVIVDEMTQAYERLHATVSLEVLHGAVDQFRFRVPAGFEITDVTSQALSRWQVKNEEGQRSLEVDLREPTTGTVVLNLSAINNAVDFDDWTMPRLVPLDVANHVAVVGMLIEDRLAAESIATEELIAIDNDVLRKALPESVFSVDPGAPQVRPVAAFYAPQDKFNLTARFTRPPAQFDVRATMLLTLGEQEQRVAGTIALVPSHEKLFTFRIAEPTGWRVVSIKGISGAPIAFERGAGPDTAQLLIKLPEGVAPGSIAKIRVEATSVPNGWLDEWTENNAQFPVFAVADSATTTGVIAVQTRDDLLSRPDQLAGLTPLGDADRASLGFEDIQGTLVYRIEDGSYAAKFAVQRMQSRITARTFCFLKVEPEGLTAHYEIVYNVQRARTRKLTFRLPEDSSAALSVNGLDATKVKEYSSQVVDGWREWTAELADPAIGQIRLAVDFTQPLAEDEPQDWELPLIRATGVAYQSATVAVEGSAEFDAQVESNGRKIDVGELVDAEYQVGKRLLGAFGFIEDPEVTIDIFQREGYGLPSAITQRAELVTLVAASGASQTAARYTLRTKASFLQISLPEHATLWSASVDGKPATPQRDGKDLVISLPPTTGETLRDLQIVYESNVARIDWMSDVESAAPRLVVRTDNGDQGYEVPTADVVWHLVLPEGHRIVRSHGSVFTDHLSRQPSSASFFGKLLYGLSGGIGQFGLGPSMILSSPDAAPTSSMRQLGLATHDMDEAAESESFQLDDMFAVPAAPMEADAEMPMLQAEAEAAPMATDKPADVNAAATSSLSTAQVDAVVPRQTATQVAGQQYWALQGVRSLKIELERVGQQVTFTSMGVKPTLRATLINTNRFWFVAWALAIVTLVFGIAKTNGCTRTKIRYVLNACVIGFALPLVIGLFSSIEATDLFAPMLFVAVMLIPYYFVAAIVRWIVTKTARSVPNTAAATTVAAIGVLIVSQSLFAPAASAQQANGAIDPSDLLLLLQPDKPIDLPKDAVIIPYDPTDENGVEKAQKVLVPYAEYTRLWNLAFPDKPLNDVKPPAAFAIADASYTATLEGSEYLVIRGTMELNVYQKSPIDIPLHLAGGVLESATLDGEAARIRVIAPQVVAPNQQAKAAAPAQAFATLLVSEPGKKRLELAVRLPIARSGGWRIVQGQLPTAPATQLSINVPSAKTELRLSGTLDRTAFETKATNETIATALPVSGGFSLQWRPAIASGQVDQTLTARSLGVLDVQEDGLRLAWQLQLQTRNNQRETFTFVVPQDYLVERVYGDNVRGWQSRPVGDEQQIDVTLLKAATGTETITLRLSRRSVVGLDGRTDIVAPAIAVPDAVLHQGQLAIRRSPLLDVRTQEAAGASRIEIGDDVLAAVLGSVVEESPLGLQEFEAYRFGASTYQLRISAEAHRASLAVEHRTVLRIGERENNVETRLKCSIGSRPIYKLEVVLPNDFDVEEVVVPGTFDWAITTDNDQQLLTVYLAAGAIGSLDVDLRGTVLRDTSGARDPNGPVAGPRFDVKNTARQSGFIVVQVDPSVDVAIASSENVESVSMGQVVSWLAASQRSLARLVVAFRSADFNVAFETIQREARVNSISVTNVRVTAREVEELIFVKLRVRRAGIREVSFLLPVSLRDAQITVPLLRQQTIESVEGDTTQVRVRLELQDEVIDELIVLVESSRPLPSGDYTAPLPTIETGDTDFRYVVIESAGRDEVVVTASDGFLELNRKLSQWKQLTEILSGNITRAYVAQAEAGEPQLAIATRRRETVETVGASIGIAQTMLLVDANGAYRGIQEYRVDNKTEQFLEIALPEGAELWTVQVAGEAVKPTVVPGAATAGHVRVPLIKTQTGDLDYAVVLKYGGDLNRLRAFRTVSFPLMKTININVEQSHVRLRLPESQKWFNFAGSMQNVTDAGELAADFVSYQTKQVQRLMQVANSDSYGVFSRIRAQSNIKLQVENAPANNPSLFGDLYGNDSGNERLQRELLSNRGVVAEASKQLEEQAQTQPDAAAFGNGFQLKQLYNDQATNRASNVVSGLDYNFDASGMEQDKPQSAANEQRFNSKWLDGNKLQQLEKKERASGSRIADTREKAPAKKSKLGFDADFLKDNKQMPQSLSERISTRDDEATQLDRYQQRLEVQNQSQQSPRRYGQAVPQTSAPSRRTRDYADGLAIQDEEAAEGMYGGGMGGGGFGGAAGGVGNRAAMAGSEQLGQTTSFAVAAAESGLTSLDVMLPERGVEYFFTTPRGDLEITAQAMPKRQINRGLGLLGILGVLIALAITHWVGKAVVARMSDGVLSSAIVGLGVLSVVTGVFPFIGIMLMVWGIAQIVRRAINGDATPAAN